MADRQFDNFDSIRIGRATVSSFRLQVGRSFEFLTLRPYEENVVKCSGFNNYQDSAFGESLSSESSQHVDSKSSQAVLQVTRSGWQPLLADSTGMSFWYITGIEGDR